MVARGSARRGGGAPHPHGRRGTPGPCGWSPAAGTSHGTGRSRGLGLVGWRRSGKADAQSGRHGLFLPGSPKRKAISRPALCALPTHVTLTRPPREGGP